MIKRWKNKHYRCFQGSVKSGGIHHAGKTSLTTKKTLGTSEELFEFATRIFVSQHCSNCTCLTLILILSPHIFFLFLLDFTFFFSSRNPRGSLKQVVHYELFKYKQILLSTILCVAPRSIALMLRHCEGDTVTFMQWRQKKRAKLMKKNIIPPVWRGPVKQKFELQWPSFDRRKKL